MPLALTREVSPRIADCELTHLARQPIDYGRAAAQHDAYERALRELGATVERLPATPELPDSVFVEDTAVVFDELAVITRPGAGSRRAETASVAPVLAAHRRLAEIVEPGTLDGGDVLAVGRTVYVGRGSRTNDAAIGQLRAIVAPFGYQVVAVPLTGCLHLKSAASRIGEALLLVNPHWVDPAAFSGCDSLSVDPAEPGAANALLLGGGLIHPRHCPRTRARLVAAGLRVVTVPSDELAKAEAGVTCCSLIIDPRPSQQAA